MFKINPLKFSCHWTFVPFLVSEIFQFTVMWPRPPCLSVQGRAEFSKFSGVPLHPPQPPRERAALTCTYRFWGFEGGELSPQRDLQAPLLLSPRLSCSVRLRPGPLQRKVKRGERHFSASSLGKQAFNRVYFPCQAFYLHATVSWAHYEPWGAWVQMKQLFLAEGASYSWHFHHLLGQCVRKHSLLCVRGARSSFSR